MKSRIPGMMSYTNDPSLRRHAAGPIVNDLTPEVRKWGLWHLAVGLVVAGLIVWEVVR